MTKSDIKILLGVAVFTGIMVWVGFTLRPDPVNHLIPIEQELVYSEYSVKECA